MEVRTRKYFTIILTYTQFLINSKNNNNYVSSLNYSHLIIKLCHSILLYLFCILQARAYLLHFADRARERAARVLQYVRHRCVPHMREMLTGVRACVLAHARACVRTCACAQTLVRAP